MLAQLSVMPSRSMPLPVGYDGFIQPMGTIVTNEEDIKAIELSVEQARKIVEFGKAIKRLEKTSEYKTVIQDGYFTEEAARLVHLTADPNMADSTRQAGIQQAIRAIAEFRMYLQVKSLEAEMAEKAIEEAKDELAQIEGEQE